MTQPSTHPSIVRDLRTLLGATLLLLVECELLVGNHYQEGRQFRALIQLPILKILLAFVGLCVITRYLGRNRLPPLPTLRFSALFAAAHILVAISIHHLVNPLWSLIQGAPSLRWLWFLVLAVFSLSWLAIVLPLSSWRSAISIHGRWLATTVAMACAAVASAYLGTISWNVSVTEPLAVATIYCSSWLLRLGFEDIVADVPHREIGTSVFHVTVGGPCSGFEGIGLIVAFTGVYLWLRRKQLRFPAAFLLTIGGILLIWALNFVRIAALVTIGNLVSPTLAVQSFHSHAGWVAFTAVGWALIFSAEKLRWFHRDPSNSLKSSYPATPLILPFSVLLFSWMVSQAFSSGFDRYYPIRMVAILAALCSQAPAYPALFKQADEEGQRDGPQRLGWSRPIAVGAVVYAGWILLAPAHGGPAVDPWTVLGRWAWPWVLVRCVGAVLIIPLVEELAFRGYLLRRIQSRHFESVPVGQLTALSILCSSLAFGLLHQAWLAGTLAGLAYAYSCSLRGKLYDAVVSHSVTNLLLAVHVLACRNWSLWG